MWGPGPTGVSAPDVLLAEVVSLAPQQVVEIGCGTGAFARRVCDALPDVDYLATDLSAAMVAETVSRGVAAAVAGAGELPVADHSVDVVIAAWMLYHVPDLEQTLREVTRVLRPGGALVAATNGDEHLGTLLRDAGGAPWHSQFSSENGTATLGRHFAHVRSEEIETWANFPDHASAAAYLSTLGDPTLRLPHFDGPRRDSGWTAVFVASGPL